MREAHTDAVEFVVCPMAHRIAEGAVGSSTRPFTSLDEALTAIRQNIVIDGDARTNPFHHLDIVCVRQPDEVRRPKRPRHQFYVESSAMSIAGDGTEHMPWPDLATGLDDLAKRHAQGDLRLAEGEQIRLSRREPFTPTSIEKVKHRTESWAKYIFMLMAMALVAPIIAILVFLVFKAWPVLSLNFLLENPRNYMTAGGIWAPLLGTFCLVLLSLLAAAPIGIMAGVYLNEYARDNWLNRIVGLAVVNLAGVPSIVHGLFGVGAFVLAANMGRSMLAAAFTLAVMTLPVIITSTREALASVPMAFREACWNMGASRWQTIRTVVLPNSISGILTGVILQVSRAAGETAPILFTGVAFSITIPESGWESVMPYSLFERCMALSMHVFTLYSQVVNVPEALPYGTAVVLIGLVLAVNSLSIVIRVYLRSRKRW
jgi:phosphate transport system permease protein